MNALDQKALEPCPFCGEDAVEHGIINMVGSTWRAVTCKGCQARSNLFKRSEDAIAAWNKRHSLAVAEAVEPVVWPGREFCETAERNVMRLAEHLRGNRHHAIAADAGLAIRTLLASPPPASSPKVSEDGCVCQDCGRTFIGDLLVPDDIWAKISPKPVDGNKTGGLLCGGCIVDRIVGRDIAAVVFAALSPDIQGDGP